MDTARRLIAEEREKKAGFLDLGNSRLTEVPAERFELTHLRSLNLGARYEVRNALATLPEGLNALGNRVALSLAGNPVSDLGPLRDLPALQSLDCGGTAVRTGSSNTMTGSKRHSLWVGRGWAALRHHRRLGVGRDPERGRNPMVAGGLGGSDPPTRATLRSCLKTKSLICMTVEPASSRLEAGSTENFAEKSMRSFLTASESSEPLGAPNRRPALQFRVGREI